jgi:hypothetical protein
MKTRIGCVFAVLGLALSGALPGLGADRVWTNAASGQYGEAGNWQSGVLPATSDNASFSRSGGGTYAINFDSPSTNPTVTDIYVSGSNDVTLNLAGHSLTATRYLEGYAPLTGKLTVNGGNLSFGSTVYMPLSGDLTLVVTNGARLTATNGTFTLPVGAHTGSLVVVGNSTTCEVSYVYMNPSGSGKSSLLIDDGATFISSAQSDCYISPQDSATATAIVDHASSWINKHFNMRLGAYANSRGTLIVRGNGSYLETSQFEVRNGAELHIGAGASVAIAKDQAHYYLYVNEGQAVHTAVVGGAGKLRLANGALPTHFYFVDFGGILQPGDDGVGTLTFEDCSVCWARAGARLEFELAGKAPGQYDRLILTNAVTASSSDKQMRMATGVTIAVTVLRSFRGYAQIGDTFDLIETGLFMDGDGGALVPSNLVLSFNDPAYDGTLSVATIGSRRALRLTLTKVYKFQGTVVNVR